MSYSNHNKRCSKCGGKGDTALGSRSLIGVPMLGSPIPGRRKKCKHCNGSGKEPVNKST